jgi:hypothetical protein
MKTVLSTNKEPQYVREVGNPGPGLGQAQNVVGLKQFMGFNLLMT